MPEYIALLHHYELSNSEGDDTPPSVEDVEMQFMAMERAGIARIH